MQLMYLVGTCAAHVQVVSSKQNILSNAIYEVHCAVQECLAAPSFLLMEQLTDLVAKCPSCGEGVKTNHIDHYLESGCAEHMNAAISSIIQKPLTAPLSAVEEKWLHILFVAIYLATLNIPLLHIHSGNCVSIAT